MMTLIEGVTLTSFAAAALAPFVGRITLAHSRAFALVPFGLLLVFLFGLGPGASSRRVWAPSIGLNLDFRVDQVGWVFALLITGIGALVFLYSGRAMKDDPGLGRFFSTLFCFMGSMLGLALADSILLIFVFWELTSVTSFLLISFKGTPAARKAGYLALFVTAAGGLALLAGLCLAGSQQGVWRLSEMKALDGAAPGSLAVLILLALGAFTKSAQFPFHGWLPEAMEAPSPVSAYLHSATMVKAGALLLAKTAPLFADMAPVWTPLIGGVGAVTLAAGAVFSLFASDLKRMLAFSTVSSLGALVMMLGFWPRPEAASAFAAFLAAHALYKGCLFLLAGIVEKKAKTRDITALSGLARRLPGPALAAGLAGLSMAGILPFMGFAAKESLLAGAGAAPWALSAAMIGGAGWVYVAIQAGWRIWQGPKDPADAPQKAGADFVFGPLALAFLGLAFGLGMAWTGPWLLDPLAASLSPGSHPHVHLWGGFTRELWLSGLSIAAGAALAWTWPRWRERAVEAPGPTSLIRASLAGLGSGSRALARLLEHGKLRWDFVTYFAAASGLAAASLILQPPSLPGGALAPVLLPEALIILGGAAAAWTSLFSPSRLAALALVGGNGLALAGLFMYLGAPDLAITQLLVDILVVIFIVVAFARLPRFSRISGAPAKIRDGVVAAAFGAVFAVLTFLAAASHGPEPISRWIAAKSVAGAKGANVVNTILVDFRGLDTLGEATVLSLAALGVFALSRLIKEGAHGREA